MDELRRLAPPPDGRPEPVDWAAAESTLGVSFPADYRSLVDAWGAGCFDDYLWVFAPGHPNPNLDLPGQTERELAALEELRADGEDVPFDTRVAAGGLLAWGITDNGDVGWWHLRDPSAPDTWTVAINESRSPEWETFDGTVVEFLVALLDRREPVSFFPDDVPSGQPDFVRADG